MGKDLAAFLNSFQRRMGDMKSQKLCQLPMLWIMIPNKEFKVNHTNKQIPEITKEQVVQGLNLVWR